MGDMGINIMNKADVYESWRLGWVQKQQNTAATRVWYWILRGDILKQHLTTNADPAGWLLHVRGRSLIVEAQMPVYMDKMSHSIVGYLCFEPKPS